MKIKSLIVNYHDDGTITMAAQGEIHVGSIVISVGIIDLPTDGRDEFLLSIGKEAAEAFEEILKESLSKGES